MMLFILFSQALSIGAVCFIPQVETIPREGLKIFKSDSLPNCKIACLQDTQCQSIAYNSTLKLCVLHGDPVDKICRSVTEYTRLVKTLEGCTRPTPDNAVTNYVRDSCLRSAVLSPEYTFLNQNGICPYSAVNGEPTPRLYFISAIRSDGTYIAFDNNLVNRLQWNTTINSYVISLYSVAAIDPVYAAVCVYYAADGPPECPCAALPPAPPGTITPAVAPSPMCNGQMRHNFGLGGTAGTSNGNATFMRCLGQKWITFPNVNGGVQNSIEIKAASCL